jgi:predicted PurR-regulated permease PerM
MRVFVILFNLRRWRILPRPVAVGVRRLCGFAQRRVTISRLSTMQPTSDITRVVFAVLFICALVLLCLRILLPFLPALLWATTIAIATWPLLLRVQKRVWNRRGLAVTVMTGTLLLVFVLPFSLAVGAIVSHAEAITDQLRSLLTLELPPLPAWVERLPFLGERIATAWNELAAAREGGLADELRPYISSVALWFAASVGNVGGLFLQFLMTVVITAILYASGESAAETVRRFAERLAGAQGDAAVRLAAQSIRAVALGVVVTAVVQAVMGGLGLLVAGVPFAALLTAVMFMLALAQLGPVLVLVPSVAWLFWSGHTGWGTFLLVWTVLVTPLDNILRPMLIKRGANLSFLLVFAGVVGGLVAFGLVGIFIGPVVLAVSSTLITAWVDAGLAPAREAARTDVASGT